MKYELTPETKIILEVKPQDVPTCEHCGSIKMNLHGCDRCGAPQCCDQCCQIASAELETKRKEYI